MADIENVATKAETTATPAAKKFERAAEKTVETVKATTETATAGLKDAQATAAEGFKDVQAKVTEGFKDVQAKVTEGLKDVQHQVTDSLKRAGETARTVVDVQRTAIETVVKAGQIYGEGLQSLATHAVDVNRAQFEDTMAHFRALAKVKSIKEAVELQTAFARATTSRVLQEGSAFVEDYLKVAGQALAPVTTRAREAAEKVKNAA
jgi:phasin family protein